MILTSIPNRPSFKIGLLLPLPNIAIDFTDGLILLLNIVHRFYMKQPHHISFQIVVILKIFNLMGVFCIKLDYVSLAFIRLN